MEQVMIIDHDPPRGDGPEKSRCGFPILGGGMMNL